MNPVRKTIDLGDGRTITLETGKLARQAHGAVVLTMGNTMLLATVVSNQGAKEGMDFLPLTVDYQEKFASVGRIPGSFMRREARPSDYEILICRIIDRTLRPLFPDDYHSETQVMVTLISSDENIMPDALTGLAASAALTISDIPFEGPISTLRVGRIDGNFLINPTKEQIALSDIDIIVAGTEHDINMVEGEMKNISEDEFLDALKFGHDAIKKMCKAQLEFCEALGGRKAAREYSHEVNDEELKAKVIADNYQKIYDIAANTKVKAERSEAFAAVLESYLADMGEEIDPKVAGMVKKYFSKAKKEAVRNMVLETKKRLDGRGLADVRPIWSEVDFLPAAHGSALFTRGETQSLTSVTLGSKLDQQLLDSPMLSGYGRLMLHYNFPGFSTGEAKPNRGTSRREIGHGYLALRGLKGMLPDDVSYTVRIVSDILESNGSSSMATVCAGSLALMDAGIKMKGPVSGIAMGMISDETTGKYAVLSDILGDEDHLGDMDFKVIGSQEGILACQMDIKVNGLSFDVLREALYQSRDGRLHILGEMNKTMAEAREELKPHTPRIDKFFIEKDKIGAVIGSGGKVIQEIQAVTGATISIDEADNKGVVEIMSANAESMRQAKEWVMGIVTDPIVGTVYKGKVKSIMEYGAFVEFMPGKEGLLHISEITWERLGSMEGVYSDGQEVDVKLMDVDIRSGKFKLSAKVLTEKPEGYVEPKPSERSDNFRGRSGGDRDRDRGRGRDDRDRGPRRDSR